jgi:hypothetical protein
MRNLLDGTDAEELDEPVILTIKTKCPGKWLLADKETGYSPNFVRLNKRIPSEHLNTPLTFKFQYFDYLV